jgi:uncharacterized SAM-binding protein YcdF (DUF218 family)
MKMVTKILWFPVFLVFTTFICLWGILEAALFYFKEDEQMFEDQPQDYKHFINGGRR